MACSNCNKPSCGCSGTYVVSKTCPPACSEVFNASCIVYTGVDLTCTDAISGLTSTVISRNDYLDTALTAIVNYICARFNPANLPSSVVVSGDDFVVVSASTVGYVTTYTVTLDPAGLPSASIVTAGDNVVVTGDGSAGNPYVVNANESIVAVDPASALTLIVDPSTPGPYETTYTIGVDASLLPITALQTSFGHISITEIPNTPNAGDTTYTLEVDEVTIQSDDDKLAVTLLSAGGIAPFERTFNVAIDDAEMTEFIQDVAGATIVGGTDIIVTYNDIAGTITVTSTAGSPLAWFTMSDGVTDISAASNTDKLNIVGDAVTNGITTTLTAVGPNEATFTINNEDRGSAQLTFLNVDCSNISGNPGGTATATINEDTLELVGGSDIDLTVIGNQIQIDNLIDRVYAEIQSDAGDTLQAPNTTSTFTIAGGTGIGTIGNLGTQTITINNEALVYSTITGDTGSSPASGFSETLAIVSAGGGCSTTVTADTVTIENTSNIYSTIAADTGTPTTASGLTDTLNIVGSVNGVGEGVTTTVTPDTITIATTFNKYGTSATLPNVGDPLATLNIIHGLNALNSQVGVVDTATGVHLGLNTDFRVTNNGANAVYIETLNAAYNGAAVLVSVLG